MPVEITYTVECLEEHLPIEGNCSAIDDETDKATEKRIKDELANGNPWAWCCIKVTASFGGFTGVDYLGGCSYESEGDFTAPGDGYYNDMKKEARHALEVNVRAAIELGKEAAKVLVQLIE